MKFFMGSHAEVSVELRGQNVKLMPIAVETIDYLLKATMEGFRLQSTDFPEVWRVSAIAILREFPGQLVLVIKSPEFNVVNGYHLIGIFNPVMERVYND